MNRWTPAERVAVAVGTVLTVLCLIADLVTGRIV